MVPLIVPLTSTVSTVSTVNFKYVGKREMDGLKNAHSFINDLWQMIKKYYTPDPDPDGTYWHDLIEDSSQLGEKYDNDRLAQKLILAFLDYIEEKEKNNGQSTTEKTPEGAEAARPEGAA